MGNIDLAGRIDRNDRHHSPIFQAFKLQTSSEGQAQTAARARGGPAQASAPPARRAPKMSIAGRFAKQHETSSKGSKTGNPDESGS
jgi:hypothetical protein